MKKVAVSVVVALLIATMALGLVACTEKSLDGAYIDHDSSAWQLVIKGDKISLYKNSELRKEGTFTRNGDVLTTTLTGEWLKKITVTKEGNLSHPDKRGDKEIVTTFTKVKK